MITIIAYSLVGHSDHYVAEYCELEIEAKFYTCIMSHVDVVLAKFKDESYSSINRIFKKLRNLLKTKAKECRKVVKEVFVNML